MKDEILNEHHFLQVGGAAEVAVEHGRLVQVHLTGQRHEPVATRRANLRRLTSKALILSTGNFIKVRYTIFKK